MSWIEWWPYNSELMWPKFSEFQRKCWTNNHWQWWLHHLEPARQFQSSFGQLRFGLAPQPEQDATRIAIQHLCRCAHLQSNCRTKSANLRLQLDQRWDLRSGPQREGSGAVQCLKSVHYLGQQHSGPRGLCSSKCICTRLKRGQSANSRPEVSRVGWRARGLLPLLSKSSIAF